MIRLALLGMLAVTACSAQPDSPAVDNRMATPVATPTAAPASKPDYTGRWLGVEGMFLDVKPGATPATYRLTMQYDLDHKAEVDATREGDTLVFERDGKRLVLEPGDGDATGLKYLAGKKDCLTVASGEGYCRD